MVDTPLARRQRPRALSTAFVAALLLVVGIVGLAPPAAAGDDNSPPFDFTDAFYRANGVNPDRLTFRPSGTDGRSVIDTAPDRNHRNVRSLLTLPAYDHSGNHWFFTVLGDLEPNGFTANAAGRAAQRLAESAPVYVFPTRNGDPLGVGNNRQADIIDMRHGYFSNNPLGIWVHIFVTWTPRAFDTAGGREALADLRRRNGTSLDGTPIIKTLSQLEDLTRSGYVKQTKRPQSAVGRYFICPVIEDPRDGGIAPDAFLATVRRADGTPLPAERPFVTDFESLRTTGDYPD